LPKFNVRYVIEDFSIPEGFQLINVSVEVVKKQRQQIHGKCEIRN